MSPTEDVDPWRINVLNIGSAAMAAMGLMTAVWILGSSILAGEPTIGLAVTPLVIPVAICALWRGGPYRLRSALFLSAPVAMVFAITAEVGFTAGPALSGVASVVIAGLLLGTRSAVGIWILTTLLMLLANTLVHAGIVETSFTAASVDPTSLPNGIRNTLVYALFASFLALGTSVVVERLSRSLSETRRAHAAQSASDAQWRSLVENAADQILIVDRDHRIEFLNRKFEDFPEIDYVDQTIETFLSADESADVYEAIDQVFATGTPSIHALTVADESGRTRHIVSRISPVLREGEVHRVTAINSDVTERYRLEEQLLQSQKLEAVGQLAGGVAHDFNNLLTVIAGFSDDVLDRLEHDDAISRDLQKIREAAERGARLTRQLLAFSRENPTDFRPLDPNAAIESMQEILQRLLGAPYRLELELAQGVGSIRADPAQLDQVLTNLVVNARDAMPEAGPIRIETRAIRLPDDRTDVADLAPGDYVSISVIDRGVGIPPELEARIFEPFFTTKDVGKGTGLGLATSYGIIQRCDGALRIESSPGDTTRVEILLPRFAPLELAASESPVAPDAAGTHAASEPDRPGRTLLLVEDEPQVRALVLRVLSKAGYEILEASDGYEALAVAGAYPGRIDLVLSDVRMPNMSGPQLARKLREARPEIGVVFMTGFAADVDATGLDAKILSKPFSIAGLPGELESMFDD